MMEMSTMGTQNSLSRRRFLGWTQAAFAALSAAPLFASSSLSMADGAKSTASSGSSPDDYYAKLGVEKIINAAGTYTYLTAAVMPPQVQRAVAQAALHPVRLKDLQQASGEYVAKRLR